MKKGRPEAASKKKYSPCGLPVSMPPGKKVARTDTPALTDAGEMVKIALRQWLAGMLALGTAASALAQLPAGLAEDPLAILTRDGLVLAGVLTRPRDVPVRAGALLLHGSGATDMDQTVPGDLTATGVEEKPLRQLAWRLAREGFAVLRYNKRGVDTDSRLNDPQVLETASLSNLVDDARAAVGVLRATRLVPADRIVLVGHSEGSVIGSLVAEADPRIAGLACLAPLASNLREVLRYQLVTRVQAWAWTVVDTDGNGRISAAELARAPRYRMPMDRLDANADGAVDRAELASGLEREWRRFAAVQVEASPWMHEHFGLEPNAARMARLIVPVQLFHGEEDAQTPLSESRALAGALAGRACGPATLDTFPGLGHGFAPPLAPDRPTVGPIAPGALDTIAKRLATVYLTRTARLATASPPLPALERP